MQEKQVCMVTLQHQCRIIKTTPTFSSCKNLNTFEAIKPVFTKTTDALQPLRRQHWPRLWCEYQCKSATSVRERMMQLYNFSTWFLCKHSKRNSQFKSSGWNRQSVWTNCVVKTAFYSTLVIQAFLYFILNCYHIKHVVQGYEENQECAFLEAVSSHSLFWHN